MINNSVPSLERLYISITKCLCPITSTPDAFTVWSAQSVHLVYSTLDGGFAAQTGYNCVEVCRRNPEPGFTALIQTSEGC